MVTYCASTDMDNMFSNAASVAKNLLTDVLHDDVVFEKILARVELGLRRYAVPQKAKSICPQQIFFICPPPHVLC